MPGSKPTEVIAQRMTDDGLRFAPGTRPHVLLRTAQKWEGNDIEAGRLRLAYSAWTIGQVGYPEGSTCRDTAEGCNQRRLYVATLSPGPGGTLVVEERR